MTEKDTVPVNPNTERTIGPDSDPSSEETKSQEEKQRDMVDRELRFDSSSLEKEAQENLTDNEREAAAVVGRLLADHGMNIHDACQLANMDQGLFDELYENNDTFKKVIDIKQLEFKKQAQSAVAKSIKKGDKNKAYEFLERMYPEEYGKGKDKTRTKKDDILAQAIDFVQENEDAQSIINPEGNSYLMKDVKKSNKKKSDTDIQAELEEMLAGADI